MKTSYKLEPGQGMYHVRCLVGVLLISFQGGRDISSADPAPAFHLKWGSRGAADGQFDYGPIGMAVDAHGSVYVADEENHRVQKFDAEGAFLAKWGRYGSGDGEFIYCEDVAVDEAGYVYVADQGNHRIQKFTGDGTFVAKWGSLGSGPGQFGPFAPRRLAVAMGAVYVSDVYRIEAFDTLGTFLSEWGTQGSGEGQFDYAWGIAVSADQLVYVADGNNCRIQLFTADGTFVKEWGSAGTRDGEFNSPFDVDVDALGSVYVADSGNGRIQKFDSNGFFLTKWGNYGAADGEFSQPAAVAVTQGGCIFVADFGNHRVQRFGEPVNVVGIYGDAAASSACIEVAQGTTGTLYLVASIGMQSSQGITGSQFRVEVTNPSGYIFSYSPPDFAQTFGNPVDAGVAVIFPSCQPGGIPKVGDKIPLGRIDVLNIAGSTSELVLRQKSPPDALACARFWLCPPFNTPVCMESLDGSDIVFRAFLNDPNCEAGSFSSEILMLDTYEPADDGFAGPVMTAQALLAGQNYVVSVRGTFSSWSRDDWHSGQICGTPEQWPQTPSPGTINDWAGSDAEVEFASPEQGAGCPPRHSGKFQMNVGLGYSHVEPMGGQRFDPAPDHLYRYLIQGQGAAASFTWEEDIASDNYGVLTITVERSDVTDVLPVASSRLLTMLPSVPNPFNPSTLIRYILPQATYVEVNLYDLRGQLLRTLFKGQQAPGYNEVLWNGTLSDAIQAPSGVYFARVVGSGFIGSGKLTLLK